jgi:hypothetical protein
VSADNFYEFAQDPETGRWWVWTAFASACEGEYRHRPRRSSDASFGTEMEAIEFAMGQYSEYGVSQVEWPGFEGPTLGEEFAEFFFANYFDGQVPGLLTVKPEHLMLDIGELLDDFMAGSDG